MKIKNIIIGILSCILISPHIVSNASYTKEEAREIIREYESSKENNRYWFIGTLNTTANQRLEPSLEGKKDGVSYIGEQIIFHYVDEDWVGMTVGRNNDCYTVYIWADFIDINTEEYLPEEYKYLYE